jgi:hypothetical protein
MEHEEEQEVQKIRGGACEFPSFERNNYYHGKFMTVRDFRDEQCYFNQKRWLINRMVNGWGVVCGLDVKMHPKKDMSVIVTPGLAIDCLGREILVSVEKEVSLKPEESECHKKETELDETLVICLVYKKCKTEAISLPPQGNCNLKERCEFNRIMDSFHIYTRRKADICMDDLHEKICPLDYKNKTIHEYLSEKLKEKCPSCPECPKKTEIPCLILAEISKTDENFVIDQSKRKLVYGNPLLYDLIDCFHGDLPHITKINWPKPDEGPMNWSEFKNKMKDGLTITFDRRLNEDTINANTILFMVKEKDRETGYFQYMYFDDLIIDYDPNSKPGPTVTLKLNEQWIAEIFKGFSSIKEGAEFLVKLRGDLIMDSENRRALDGNFIGGELPSGNGVQGGDFVSWFSVTANEEKASKRGFKSREV